MIHYFHHFQNNGLNHIRIRMNFVQNNITSLQIKQHCFITFRTQSNGSQLMGSQYLNSRTKLVLYRLLHYPVILNNQLGYGMQQPYIFHTIAQIMGNTFVHRIDRCLKRQGIENPPPTTLHQKVRFTGSRRCFHKRMPFSHIRLDQRQRIEFALPIIEMQIRNSKQIGKPVFLFLRSRCQMIRSH